MSDSLKLDSFFLTDEYFLDPYPAFRKFHQASGIFWSEQIKAWVVTDYELVEAGLQSSDLNAGERIARLSSHFTPEERDEYRKALDVLGNWIVFQDPPDHTRLRKLINKAFTPRTIANLAPTIETIVAQLLDEVLPKENFDLVSEISFQLPALVICGLLGIPLEDRDQVRSWSDGIARLSASALATRQDALLATKAGEDAERYLVKLFAQMRQNPNESLLSKLANADSGEDRLSDFELVALTVQLFFAGFETTEGLIGNLLIALERNPEQRHAISEKRELIERAVEEALRFDSSIIKQSRVASKDVEIGGAAVKKGDYIHFMIAAANHDPRMFAEPEKFDLSRPDIPHLSFGHGIHFCIGAPLARIETVILLRQLFERAPHFRSDLDSVTYPKLFAIRKPLQLGFTV